jgi:hypothetical protein
LDKLVTMEASFTDAEMVCDSNSWATQWFAGLLTLRFPIQRFVLAEMIKASSLDVTMLARFIENSGILTNVDMLEMRVPGGIRTPRALS